MTVALATAVVTKWVVVSAVMAEAETVKVSVSVVAMLRGDGILFIFDNFIIFYCFDSTQQRQY